MAQILRRTLVVQTLASIGSRFTLRRRREKRKVKNTIVLLMRRVAQVGEGEEEENLIKVSIKLSTLLAKLNFRRERGNSKFREIERKSSYFE